MMALRKQIAASLPFLLFMTFLGLCETHADSTENGPVESQVEKTPAREEFPGTEWKAMSPAEAGMDASGLDLLRDFMQGRGCVVRHGCLIYTWGDHTERGDVASAVKPWYTYFLFRAIEEGRLASADTRVSAYMPCLEKLNAELGFKDREILFRHLATQTSCYGVKEKPGTAFDYNDWQMALFVDALFSGVYGVSYAALDAKVLDPGLSDLLQCEDNPTFCAFGGEDRPGRLAVSPRDFCRFGYLFLHEGRWKNQQLLSRAHARQCVTEPLPGSFPRTEAEPAEMCSEGRTLGSQRVPDDQCDHQGSYSWLWWINGVDRNGKRHWPDAPADIYAALGHHNGMRGMAVIPSLDIVFSWNDTALENMSEESNPLNTAFRLLREAVSAAPIPGQITANPQHRAWLVRNEDMNRDGKLDPLFLCGPGDPEGFLYRGTRRPDATREGDQGAIIEKMKNAGANALYLIAVRSHGGDGDVLENPFVDGEPGKGLSEVILQQWESWFEAMDASGITIFFIFYDDGASIWPTGDNVGDEERAFLERIVRRFEHHRNWIWCVAEEYEEAFSAARVRQIAAVIRGMDKHRHVIAVHKNHSLSFEEFADDVNIGQFAVQYNVDTPEALHEGLLTAWRNADGRYNLNMAEASGFGFGVAAREKFWACAMAGAYVMALDWRFDKPDAPSVEDLKTCGYLVRFFEAANFGEMSPHDELRAGGTQYVLAAPDDRYIAYTSKPGKTMGLNLVHAGTYALTWFNPATGRYFVEKGVKAAGDEQCWKRPPGFEEAAALRVIRLSNLAD